MCLLKSSAFPWNDSAIVVLQKKEGDAYFRKVSPGGGVEWRMPLQQQGREEERVQVEVEETNGQALWGPEIQKAQYGRDP